MAISMTLTAQTDWTQFDHLMSEASYKSAFAFAEKVYNGRADGATRLAAAYHMSLAASHYQEDARDSAEARFRALLPTLPPLEKALCHAFLGEYDSALTASEVLKDTPVESIAMYCYGESTQNMTPTAYDVVALMAQDRGNLTPQQRVDLQRQVLTFHAGDSVGLRLWHELRLLDLMEGVPNHPVDDAQIEQTIDRYRSSRNPRLALLYVRMARRLEGREDYLGALRWCDSAVMLAPQSEGGVQAANIKGEILQRQVSVEVKGLTVAPGVGSLQRVRYRNTDHLWFRVVPYVEDFQYGDRKTNKLLSLKPLKQWDVSVPGDDGHRYVETCLDFPPFDAGNYILMVCPTSDFKKDGFMAYEFNVTDLYIIQSHQQGLVLDRSTGRPIVGQQLRLERSNYKTPSRVLQTVVTGSDGRYRFTITDEMWGDSVKAERGGFHFASRYFQYGNHADSTMRLHSELRTDQPIYRPGDTVRMAVLFYRSNGVDAQVAAGQVVEAAFLDPNGKEVSTEKLTADDYGIAHTTFAVPVDRLPGQYSIRLVADGLQEGYAAVRVEEYKQPKFMVTLGASASEAPRFGSPLKVEGMAASYSAVPVGGAKVHYTVVRRQLGYWWWRWWGVVKEEQVSEGELTTSADGSFDIVFTPWPDSTVELSDKPTFEYAVRVDVTDLNGESHPAETSVRVGFRNAFLSLEEGCTMDNLKVLYRDINGQPLPGKPSVLVERLQQPDVPLLDHPLLKAGVRPNMSAEAFRKMFPRLAYSTEYNDMSRWPGTPTSDYRPSGVYRITLSAPDADTVVEYRTVVRATARKVPSQQLLWAEVDKSSAEVGEKVTLRLGTRFKGVEAYYLLRVADRELDFRRITLDDELVSIAIGVDSAMLGGFQIDVTTVMEGIEERFSKWVEVPYSHKKLKVEISTFRDKLLPGEQEEWTVRVTGNQGAEESALILTMYDDALNSYGSSYPWGFSPWRINYSMPWTTVQFSQDILYRLTQFRYQNYRGRYPNVWTLKEALPSYYGFSGIRLYKSAAARGAVTANSMVVVEEEAAMDMAMADSKEAAPMAEEVTQQASDEGGTNPEVTLRSNLATLAFFAPDLRTDSDGTATYRFTVPDLLTRWNVRGMAVTRDIKIGTLDRTLVTSKPLMVQPNLPRFLRSGDSLSLLAKVVLADAAAEPVEVAVDFLLTDAATGDILCHHTEHIALTTTAQVAFPVEVPHNVYVATYRIVAHAEGMSDGEQGQVPVVTNRQAVTVSQALYINGVGEKHYAMPEWLVDDASREPLLLAAELTSNPLWLAVKVMPYLHDLANPSTPYLANQLYVNTLGKTLLEKLDVLAHLDKLLENKESRLSLNQDVKQTLLQATPWVCAAESEESQMQAVRHYFDSDALAAQRTALATQLAERQNSDGGWSWMPDGKSSLWVTQQVLRQLAGQDLVPPSLTRKALAYIDREQQRHYERYIKPYLKRGYSCAPTDIDYLYTRSFYGKATTEAYRFYYSNALKQYPRYENLYSQAQLALIFHRHGDRKAALDLLRRLKEKSLTSDEMGLYWRDNRSGWFWYSRPIETQALLIQAFADIDPADSLAIGQMQQWLLKQKQTTHWGNERATAEAIRALVLRSDANDRATASMTLFGQPLTATATGLEGYRSQRWTGAALDTLRQSGSSDIVVRKDDKGIAWGAVYYQFTDDMDRIPSTDMGITVRRTYLRSKASAADTVPLRVGDRVKVRIDIQCDRAMDYLELVDGRPSCTEPLSTRAGWRWNDGLAYYISVNRTDTRCYIEHLDKGKYWFEYEVYITNPGHFLSGPLTMQCMYAPEFRATAPAQRIEVAP